MMDEEFKLDVTSVLVLAIISIPFGIAYVITGNLLLFIVFSIWAGAALIYSLIYRIYSRMMCNIYKLAQDFANQLEKDSEE